METCICGHVQQKTGMTWTNDGIIHTISHHRGTCKKCPHTGSFGSDVADILLIIGSIIFFGFIFG